ncbi:hypothetical protein [Brevibacterium sp. FME37]|uniref:hypothetical protein n=1 Tax=Brevibacterium sp. FME37 TaxID=2742607 RepID=UPI001868CFB6|nr:hypothetical protein [Brevibacterium sp. FME37]
MTRTEVTAKYGRRDKKASQKNKRAVLNEVVTVTGWTRDNSRRRLTQAANTRQGPGDRSFRAS